MEALSSKEFFEQLKANTLRPSLVLKGIVKKSDKDSEVLFAKKGDFTNWVKIPAAVITSVNVLKTFTKEDKTFTVVKLHLKSPETPEAKALYDLLALTTKDEMGEGKTCGKGEGFSGFHAGGSGECLGMLKGKFGGMGGHFCPHCGCHHGGYGGGCGCGCHHHSGCGCYDCQSHG